LTADRAVRHVKLIAGPSEAAETPGIFKPAQRIQRRKIVLRGVIREFLSPMDVLKHRFTGGATTSYY
jgi:hypothetical protein